MVWELHNVLVHFMLLLFVLFFFFLIIGTYYAKLIHRKYPRIPLIEVRNCPVCGRKVVQEKSTRNIFLFPHLFKSLRHYEKYHSDIAVHSRKARIFMSLSINSGIFCVILVLTLWSVEPIAGLSFEEYMLYFTSAFIGALIFIWLLIAIFLYKILPKWEADRFDRHSKAKV